jgi:putative pyruvate formate lyase activating enzyme
MIALIETKIAILEKNLPVAMDYFNPCRVCPRECLVDRPGGELGECGMPARLKVSSANLHFGEEPPISGVDGSGTIFLAGCNLHCVYCQNYPLSQLHHGEFYSTARVASMMLNLQKKGAHNINLVTPSHYVPLLMEVLLTAYRSGLKIPIVYNSSGYDSLDMLRLLEGIVDIYMPDMRYADSESSEKYSDAADYPEINQQAIKEMHRQTGVLKVINGIAVSGVLIRHLVLPEGISGSKKIFRFIAGEISRETYVAVMSQYFPAYNAYLHSSISRRLTSEEYETSISEFEQAGLKNGYIQPYMG